MGLARSGAGGAAGAALCAALLCSLPAAPARAEVQPLTLYQKTARAALVVRAEATSDSTRRPTLRIIEIFKGSHDGWQLVIVPFRQDYSSEKPWLRPEVFRKGREYLLFLNPYEPDTEEDDFDVETPDPGGDDRESPLFVVLNAHMGMLEMPAEGAEAISTALRRFSRIIILNDFDAQALELRAMLSESNPYMVEAALHQVSEQFLAADEDLEPLLSLLGSERPAFRAGALRILGQLAGESERLRSRQSDRERLFEMVVAVAYEDPAPEARAQAAWTLGRIGGPAARGVLRRMSRNDASQEVRYQAEVALAEMSGLLPDRRRR